MLLAYTLLLRRNALVEQIYAPVHCFVPNNPSKIIEWVSQTKYSNAHLLPNAPLSSVSS